MILKSRSRVCLRMISSTFPWKRWCSKCSSMGCLRRKVMRRLVRKQKRSEGLAVAWAPPIAAADLMRDLQ